MAKKLLKNISWLFTFNETNETLQNVDVLLDGNQISQIGKNINCPEAETLDMCGKAVLPGFVNTHHHLYQTLFRGIDEVQEKPLFPWLVGLYEFWKHLTDETVYYGSMVGFSELLKTGCTTTTDHHYVFPQNTSSFLIDKQFSAAEEIGIRFHATRGSMSLGKDKGGLPPNQVVQTEEQILEDSVRLIEKFHDNKNLSMKRVALAPCSPFSVTKELMKNSAQLSEKYGIMLHTHLCETIDEENFCLEKYGLRPVDLMEDVGWLNERVWFAHGIFFNDTELARLKKAGVGIAHCPSSNMKLGSGICRTSELVRMGIKIGVAVDGSASNDGSSMWEEVRRAYLLNHLKYAENGLSAMQTLEMATKGGAKVLGRNDIGSVETGKGADLIAINLNDIAYAGCHSVATAIVCCGNTSVVDTTIVNGEVVVRGGKLLTIDEEKIRKEAVSHSESLVKTERGL